MKKIITIIAVIGATLIILDTINAANSFVIFLFAGVIPGTDVRISPIDMMAATATAFTVIVLRLTLWPAIRASLFTPEVKPTSRIKRTVRRTA